MKKDLRFEAKIRYIKTILEREYEKKNLDSRFYITETDRGLDFHIPKMRTFSITENNIDHYYFNITKIMSDLSNCLTGETVMCRFTDKVCIGVNCFTCRYFNFSEEDIEERKVENGKR